MSSSKTNFLSNKEEKGLQSQWLIYSAHKSSSCRENQEYVKNLWFEISTLDNVPNLKYIFRYHLTYLLKNEI